MTETKISRINKTEANNNQQWTAQSSCLISILMINEEWQRIEYARLKTFISGEMMNVVRVTG